ncbi:MAG TPA: NmrA family NAD(P)-binding protein [Actinomycetes bacterium]|nr:NmrA family NAD(P)-binding protein [Actinomycetes bacterium]
MYDVVVGRGEAERRPGTAHRRGIPHLDSKRQVEQHIRATRLPATILRPVSFMDGLQARGSAASR